MLSDCIVEQWRAGWQPLKSAGAEILLAPQMHVCPRRNPAASRRSGVELWVLEPLFGRVGEFLSASTHRFFAASALRWSLAVDSWLLHNSLANAGGGGDV